MWPGKKLIFILTSHERRSAVLLTGMILVMAFVDMLGVASILQFMAVLTNPEVVETNGLINKVFLFSGSLGIKTIEHFLFVLGFIVFILLIASLALKALTIYFTARFALMIEYSIGKRLIQGYLYRPYSWFLYRNGTDLGKIILSEVAITVGNGVIPMMTIIAQGAVALSLLILLLLTDPLTALTVGAVFVVVYLGVLASTRGTLKRIGEVRVETNHGRFTTVSEVFGAIKAVKFSGLEDTYIKRYDKSAVAYARAQSAASVIIQTPRFLFEAIAFGGILLAILYVMREGRNFEEIIPIIALYTFAGYRLMPAVTQIYQCLSLLRLANPSLEIIYRDLRDVAPVHLKIDAHNPIILDKAICLYRVSFRYPNTTDSTLNCIDLDIPARSIVGIVGPTGSGKTTLVDIILGLLVPEKGHIAVDGHVINQSNRSEWQRTIGYVPQQIYLADDDVSANIAFGVSRQDIDQEAVVRAAKIANLHDFVSSELPKGYETSVGEAGIRLSGGQRQRIGIARALYNNPKILVLDEATSGLDELTETTVMDDINKLRDSLTVILIAHRQSAIRHCDLIYVLEKGKLKAKGTYENIIAGNY